MSTHNCKQQKTSSRMHHWNISSAQGSNQWHQSKGAAGKYPTILSIMSLYTALCLAHPLASLPKRKAESDSSHQTSLLHAFSDMKLPDSSQESLSPLKAGHLHWVRHWSPQNIRSEPKLGHHFVGLAMPPTCTHQKTPRSISQEGGVGEGSNFWQWKCNGTFCIDLLWNKSFLEWLASSSPRFPTLKLWTARNEPR